MSFAQDLFNVLEACAPTKVFADFAPVGTARPYVTYQRVGGAVINSITNAKPGKRNAEVQVNVWADSRKDADILSGTIEDALRAATAFQARPIGAPAGDFDADVPIYGNIQDFSCWFDG